MLAHVAGAGRDQFIGQHRVLVNVGHENLALILIRIGVGQVDSRPAVGRAVTVIRDRANVTVDVRVEMATGLPMVRAAGDDVPQMRDHAGADEQLPLGVVVDAPRVAEAVRDNLKHVLGRVITPNAAVDRLAFALKLDRLGIRLAVLENLAFPLRLSNHRRSEHSLAAVDPAVRPPVQAVENLVPVADAPAGQAHLDVINIGLVVLVAIRDEQQIRRRAEPQTVEPHRHGGRKRNALEKHRALVGNAVTVSVFQNQDATVARGGEAAAARFVVTVFGHPHAALVVPAKRHRLGDHRLVGP